MNKPPLLRAEHLSKTYPDGQVNALVDVNLSIAQGEYVAIMGPSGCGKSTLLNLLGALDQPSQGAVYFEGRALAELGDLDQFRSQKLGFVFQSFYLLPTLTALENVQLPMFEGPLAVRQRLRKARELLDAVGVGPRADHLPVRLSVGERQRVAIARALANDPVLLLADEPTGNLDSRTAADVLDLFDALHRQRGMTIVLVTHGQEVADRAGRVLRMRDGRLVADAPSPFPSPPAAGGEGKGEGGDVSA
jgi:putative ABC transport system ATP-binding protein